MRDISLILGGGGFVGDYLIRQLTGAGETVHATKLPQEQIQAACTVHDLDILDSAAVAALLQTLQPARIYHLAAQSSVAVSWKNPQLTVDVNIKGTLNVLDAVRQLGEQPRILLIGSGEEYGHVRDGACPITEEEALHPGNIYAATKACQGMLGEIYAKAYGMDILCVRAFNHVGPMQAPAFVVSDFCRQAARIEQGLQPPVISVGNLSARRDFTDVRDVVRAYAVLMQHGKSGGVYNVGSGRAVAIQAILDEILQLSTAKITVEQDPARLRPVDVPVIEADISRLRTDTGWVPEISLTQTLTDTLAYWRAQSLA